MITTHTGKQIDPASPESWDIHIEDIAHALSHLCRFGGHTREFYSVAQHSVRVARAVSRKNRLVALLHDATEAYLVDIPSPLKALLPDYRALEQGAWYAIADHYKLPRIIPEEVKVADECALWTEFHDYYDHPPHGLDTRELYPSEPALSPAAAKESFLSYFEEAVLCRGAVWKDVAL
jgi:hypothetical protein